MNTTHITDEQIQELKLEAALAGDDCQVRLCRRALNGDDWARQKCIEVLARAEGRVWDVR